MSCMCAPCFAQGEAEIAKTGNLRHSVNVWAVGSIYIVCFALQCSSPFNKSVLKRLLDLF